MNKIIVLSLLGFTTFSLTACGGCPLTQDAMVGIILRTI